MLVDEGEGASGAGLDGEGKPSEAEEMRSETPPT
jgi:hypothetical protein